MSISTLKELIWLAITLLLTVPLNSCTKAGGSSTESYSADRDIIEVRELVSIDDVLPPIHGQAKMFMYGDTLIIFDWKSRDRLFHCYDVNSNQYLGAFGRYGAGPGEIANFGAVVIDPHSGILYGVDLNKWDVLGFRLKEAISDTTYMPFKQVEFNRDEGLRTVNRATYVNDSTVFCAIVIPNSNYTGIGYHLGCFNLLTGKSRTLDSDNSDANSGLLCINPHQDEIIEFSMDFDRIRFYDFQGNLKRTVYGPDYKDYNSRIQYYLSPIIVGDHIYSAYLNGEYKDSDVGHRIIIMDLEGNYIKSVDVGVRVDAIAYNPSTRRIYVSTCDEPQFGYFEIDD